jgi:hypothetical protein
MKSFGTMDPAVRLSDDVHARLGQGPEMLASFGPSPAKNENDSPIDQQRFAEIQIRGAAPLDVST